MDTGLRPADLFFTMRGYPPTALDISVVHPGLHGRTGKGSLRKATSDNHSLYDTTCAAAGIQFKTFVVSSWGSLDDEDKEVLECTTSSSPATLLTTLWC